VGCAAGSAVNVPLAWVMPLKNRASPGDVFCAPGCDLWRGRKISEGRLLEGLCEIAPLRTTGPPGQCGQRCFGQPREEFRVAPDVFILCAVLVDETCAYCESGPDRERSRLRTDGAGSFYVEAFRKNCRRPGRLPDNAYGYAQNAARSASNSRPSMWKIRAARRCVRVERA